MSKRYDFRKYESWSYDDDFCLKPPFLLKASILYLCRSLLLFGLFVISSTRGQVTGIEKLIPGGEHAAALALSGIPALLVFYALLRRSPSGSGFARWVWQHGRTLLATSAVMEVCAALLFLYSGAAAVGEFGAVRFALLLLDVYILAYVLMSVRVRDTFSDFPAG